MAVYSDIRYNFTPPESTTSAQVGTSVQQLIKTITVSSGTTDVSFIHGSNDVVLTDSLNICISCSVVKSNACGTISLRSRTC